MLCRQVFRWGGAVLFCALLSPSGPALASTASTCERDGVGVLYSYAVQLKAADDAKVARPLLNTILTQLETGGFWRRCPEIKSRISSNFDILSRFSPDGLKKFLEKANTGMTIAQWENTALTTHTAVLQAAAANGGGGGTTSGAPSTTCEDHARACNKDYVKMYDDFRAIGGSEKYEDMCVKATGNDRPRDAECDRLVALRGEGIDELTEGAAFADKHSSCKSAKSSCPADYFHRVKYTLEAIHRRNVKYSQVEIPTLITLSYSARSECVDRLGKLIGVPGATVADVTGAEPYCVALYKELVKKRDADPEVNKCATGFTKDALGDCVENPATSGDEGGGNGTEGGTGGSGNQPTCDEGKTYNPDTQMCCAEGADPICVAPGQGGTN